MARRLPEQKSDATPSTEIPGGAPGLPERAFVPEAAHEIPEPGKAVARAAPSPEAVEVEVKRYRVTNPPRSGMSGYPILYNGVRTLLAQGKIVDSNTYDLDYLKRQGVTLEPVE